MQKSKLIRFLQIIGFIGLAAAILATVMPAISAIIIALKIIILFIVLVVTLGLILFNAEYRALWKDIDYIPLDLFQNIGNILYAVAIVFGILTLVMVILKRKQLLKFKKYLTTSLIISGVSVLGIIIHYLLYTYVYK
ncbi:MAG TPA: hypothetical protein PKH00_03115 [Bacilli bacterium]|nr:hypothetical protein [Bacilli bacterium]MDD3623558.1 hypothetical protein [Bacilli bacterium]HNZ74384.1 hypothetical protein [Bacilli bacterium]HOH58844.1 hypothetical protein [Bacilli bacterium]